MIDYPEGQQVAGVQHHFIQEEGTSGQVNIFQMYLQYIANILFSISSIFMTTQRIS